MNDRHLHDLLTEIAADQTDLADLPSRVVHLSVRRARRRRTLLTGLAAAVVLVVSAGALIFPRLAGEPSTTPVPVGTSPVPTTRESGPTTPPARTDEPGTSPVPTTRESGPTTPPARTDEPGTSPVPTTRESGPTTPPARTDEPASPTPTSNNARPIVSAAVMPPASLSVTPAFGTTDLPAGAIVSVVVSHGVLVELTARVSDGSTLTGTFSADRTRWTSAPLRAGLGYQLVGYGQGPNAQGIGIDGTYATIGANLAGVVLTPEAAETVGVAQPIELAFPAEPVDKAAVERAVQVHTNDPVAGAWHWVHESGDPRWILTYRPETYWPARIGVSVEADVFGARLVDGTTVGSDVTTGFDTGRSQTVRVDGTTGRLTVVADCGAASPPPGCGRTLASFPVTIGRSGQLPESGVHVVTEKLPTRLVSNEMFTYASITARYQMRMSNGQLITPLSGTDANGKAVDLTRDSIALSATDAKALFDLVQVGDPVEVTGAAPAPTGLASDDPVWNVPWSTWSSSTGR